MLTGRTTLWPPLFELLWDKLHEPENPEILWHFGDPSAMKLSVVEGAAQVVFGEQNEPVIAAPIHIGIRPRATQF